MVSNLQTESMTMVSPTFCTSCFAHILPMLPPTEFISLSVSASMQCWALCAGILPPSNAVFISPRPALGGGISSGGGGWGEGGGRAASGRHLGPGVSFEVRLDGGRGRHWQENKGGAGAPPCGDIGLAVESAARWGQFSAFT